MTPTGDLDERTADGLLAGRPVPDEPALTDFVQQLQLLASLPAPEPTGELAALLAGGLTTDTLVLPVAPAVPARWWRPRGWALPLQLGLGAAACLGLVLGVAATDQLPAPAQTAVAEVVEAITPLHLPRPEHRPARPAVVVPSPGTQPSVQPTEPAQTPEAQPTPRSVAPAGTTSHEDGTGAGSNGGEQSGTSAGSGDDRQDAPSSPAPVVQKPADGGTGTDGGDAPDGDSSHG